MGDHIRYIECSIAQYQGLNLGAYRTEHGPWIPIVNDKEREYSGAPYISLSEAQKAAIEVATSEFNTEIDPSKLKWSTDLPKGIRYLKRI